MLYYPEMAMLKSEDERGVTGRTEMEEFCRTHEAGLSHVNNPASQIHVAKQQALPALISELWNAAFQMRDEKALGNGDINVDLVKVGGHEL